MRLPEKNDARIFNKASCCRFIYAALFSDVYHRVRCPLLIIYLITEHGTAIFLKLFTVLLRE
jgi:hypothetical protein